MKNSVVTCGILVASLLTFVACSKSSAPEPMEQEKVVTASTEDCEVFAREFGADCDIPDLESEQMQNLNNNVNGNGVSAGNSALQAQAYEKQSEVEKLYPLAFSSANKQFPLRGSWRMTRAEIEDIVERKLWSPEKGKVVNLLDDFRLVLLVNIGRRNSQTAANSSTQRMQVFSRVGNTDQFERIKVWKISSGYPPAPKKIKTMTGVFKFNPSRVYKSYKSNTFNGANMYETMFLYHHYTSGRETGIAIHGTYNNAKLGRRDSGGCIRLARENSQCLYNTIRGNIKDSCLGTGSSNYWGQVPSVQAKYGEMDPEFLSSGNLQVGGYQVLVVIFEDLNDKL